MNNALIREASGSKRRLDIRLLGGLRIELDGAPLELTGQRRLCILAVLLLNHGRTVSRADLADWAWPDDAPATVDRQITNYISALRGLLAPAGDRIQLTARHPGFTALITPDDLDTDRFTGSVAQARTARRGREHEAAADRLREALGLWHGNPLDGLDTPYLRRRAQALEDERRDAVMLLAEISMEAGTPAEAVRLLRDLAAQQPENEAVSTALIRALTGAGQTAEAADVAARAQRLLTAEGRLPTTALKEAHSDALAGRVPRAAGRISGPRYQLPADTGAFTGRERELAELLALAEQAEAGHGRGAVVIGALDGMPGVGKTALAIHAGHAVADRFPDGQLFLDLHGYTDGMTARDPADALAAVLQSLGVVPQQIPEDLDARAALYRDRLAGTRTLVVLDNAVSEAQVRPLLPAGDQCLVLVTSRKRFKALDDALFLPLDVLPLPAALALFRQVAGPGRVAPHDPALGRIAELCGHLPLALRITAALLRHRTSWTLPELAQRLEATASNLSTFFDGDRDLATVFDLSYRSLGSRQQSAFRALGLVPGPDTDAYAIAALLDQDPSGCEQLLQSLVDHNLLAEPVVGRYRMHDLIRRHARALAEHEPGRRRTAAMERLLDYYQHTAGRADALIARFPRPHPAGPAPAHAPALPDQDAARGWLRAERANLLAALGQAGGDDQGARVVALSQGLASLLRIDGPWTLAMTVHSTAFTAAERLGDRTGQARALEYRGALRLLANDYPAATQDLESALARYRELDDRRGQAGALTSLGAVRLLTGDFPGATRDLEAAVELSRGLDDRLGQAHALTEIGAVRYLEGDCPGAAPVLDAALRLYEELGDRRGQANVLIRQGAVELAAGDQDRALRDLEAALELHRELGERLGQAHALTQLGPARASRGDSPGAARDLEAALGLYRDLGDRTGEAWALNYYGALLTTAGEFQRAESVYRDALSLARHVQRPDGEALALEGIGEALVRQGSVPDGVARLEQALGIYRRLDRPADLDRVQARLSTIAEER